MKWSPGQDAALKSFQRWLKDRPTPWFTMLGYAGTGKTTLAIEMASMVEGEKHSGAYAGKAASVLRDKGMPNAGTLHSLLYRTQEKSAVRLKELEAEFAQLRAQNPIKHKVRLEELEIQISLEKRNLSRPNFKLNEISPLIRSKLLIVDEAFMVDEPMGEDILSFNVPVLFLGDPGQLPPIGGKSFLNNKKPDVFLSEIHRQARDNPIIDLATRVRNGEALPLGRYGSSRVVAKVEAEDALAADQLLVGRNRTRQATNARMRTLLGRRSSDWPVAGERLVCLRNDHEIGLLNGTMWRCLENATDVGGDYLGLCIEPLEGGPAIGVDAHKAHFVGGELSHWERREAQEFDFGYALTVHKSQGSQWDKVMVFDEWKREHHDKWLYTAITRAVDSVCVVKM